MPFVDDGISSPPANDIDQAGAGIPTSGPRAVGPNIDPPPLGSAPAIIRGTYDLSRAAGVVQGRLTSSAARQANFTALQGAINATASAGKFAELPPGEYDIEGGQVQGAINCGLQIPSDLVALIGSSGFNTAGTRIAQFAQNQPVITIGDTTSDVNKIFAGQVRGIRVGYGADQTNQSQAIAIQVGRCFGAMIEDISEDPYLTGGFFKAYETFVLKTANGSFFFSSIVRNMRLTSAQKTFIRRANNGTGNLWDNIYVGGGTFGSRMAISGPAVQFSQGGIQDGLGSIRQLNIEWIECSEALVLDGEGQGVIDALHFEGIKLTGFSPHLIRGTTANVQIHGLNIVDLWVPSTVTGSPSILHGNYNTQFKVRGLDCAWNGAAYNAEAQLEADIALATVDNTTGGMITDSVDIEGFLVFNGTGINNRLVADATIPKATYGSFSKFSGYKSNKTRSRMTGVRTDITDAAYSAWGVFEDQTLVYNGAITANRAVTLQPYIAASGALSRAWRRDGDMVRVVRANSATGAFNVTISDNNANVLATLTAAGQEATFVCYGGRWYLSTASTMRDLKIIRTIGFATDQNFDTENRQLRYYTNAAGCAFTLNNNLPVGWSCEVVQKGAAQVTFTAATNTTILNRAGQTKTGGVGAKCYLEVTENSDGAHAVYILSGDTGA